MKVRKFIALTADDLHTIPTPFHTNKNKKYDTIFTEKKTSKFQLKFVFVMEFKTNIKRTRE